MRSTKHIYFHGVEKEKFATLLLDYPTGEYESHNDSEWFQIIIEDVRVAWFLDKTEKEG